jgi:hypothetical protein
MEYKTRKHRIKIFKNIARKLCKNPEIVISYRRDIDGRGLMKEDGKVIYIKPSSHGWPNSLLDEISTLLHEICHVNRKHYQANKRTSEMELEAEKFTQEYMQKFIKDKEFRRKFGLI